MKVLFIPFLLVPTLYAADCSKFIQSNDTKVNTEVYCRRISSMYITDAYDRASIRTGIRFSTLKDKDFNDVAGWVMKENEQCYQTCLLANGI